MHSKQRVHDRSVFSSNRLQERDLLDASVATFVLGPRASELTVTEAQVLIGVYCVNCGDRRMAQAAA